MKRVLLYRLVIWYLVLITLNVTYIKKIQQNTAFCFHVLVILKNGRDYSYWDSVIKVSTSSSSTSRSFLPRGFSQPSKSNKFPAQQLFTFLSRFFLSPLFKHYLKSSFFNEKWSFLDVYKSSVLVFDEINSCAGSSSVDFPLRSGPITQSKYIYYRKNSVFVFFWSEAI